MRTMRALALFAAGLLGCGGVVEGDPDSGATADARELPDGREADAVEARDSGGPDGTEVDGGVLDSGAVDAEVLDSSPPDAMEATITVTVEGLGRVSSSPAGIVDCRDSCSHSFLVGTEVVLTATPLRPDATFLGWTGGDCTGVDTCTIDVSSSVTVVATFYIPNYVFVTSTVVDVPFGGLAGADARCQEFATLGDLPGTYVAYLSTSDTDAIDRLAGSRGWIRPDGKPFVDSLADLAAGHILYPPRLDERGQPHDNVEVFTGTGEDGRRVGPTCQDWTSTDSEESTDAGEPNAGSALFSYSYAQLVRDRRASTVSGWAPIARSLSPRSRGVSRSCPLDGIPAPSTVPTPTARRRPTPPASRGPSRRCSPPPVRGRCHASTRAVSRGFVPTATPSPPPRRRRSPATTSTSPST
jgi:hypothetical protein